MFGGLRIMRGGDIRLLSGETESLKRSKSPSGMAEQGFALLGVAQQ